MLVRPKAWKRWWKRFSLFTLREKGVGDTAPLLWDCPGSAHRAKRDFVRSCSSVTGQQTHQICCILVLIHAVNGQEVPWEHCLMGIVGWMQISEIQRSEKWGRKGQWEYSTFQGQIFSFTPCSRGGAAQRAVPAVPTSPGTPDKASLYCLSFILYPLSLILYPWSFLLDPLLLLLPLALGKEQPWPFVKPTVQSLGLQTLQAAPSQTSLSKCSFPALCLLAEDGLLNILS